MEGLAAYDSTSSSETSSNCSSTDDDLPLENREGLKRSPPCEIEPPPCKKPRDAPKVLLPSPLDLLDGHNDIASLEEPYHNSPEENPALHDNRVRKFPHVVGNYATTVFIPVTIPSEFMPTFDWILQELEDNLPDVHPMKASKLVDGSTLRQKSKFSGDGQESNSTGPESEKNLTLHMSISRVVTIRYPDIEMFIGTLRRCLKEVKIDKRFQLEFGPLNCFVNDDSTRSFAALTLKSGGLEVCQLVDGVNKAFVPYALPQFYEEPNPHVSVAWVLGDKSEMMIAVLDRINKSSRFLDHPKTTVQVGQVHCRVGQETYNVW
ncbi:hypothetical protein BSKO_01230 [Bryopsis sp. KO-2023]|nr:hypothetical protein BSKO_01230 [Bryopsis sp. KO-2023]